MKLWEVIYWLDGVHVTEHIEGYTRIQAQGVIVRCYLRDIDFISTKEVAHA